MTCPDCGKKTRVVNSRTPDEPNGSGPLIREANKAAGWYTQDIIARERRCTCGNTFFTVELSVSDLDKLIEEKQGISR
jgi:transcriptional regulator NrdR family protein